MPIAQSLLELLVSPATSQPLTEVDDGLVTCDQSEVYPLIHGIPWMLPNPKSSLLDWSAKLNHFNQILAEEIKVLERERQRSQGATLERLSRLVEGKQAFCKEVNELLYPVIQSRRAAKPIYDALRDKAPSTQNLLSYEANFYRDWVWGQEENETTASIVAQHLTHLPIETMLVPGAGAGRLALDLHAALKPTLSVATDINPLLVMAVNQLFSGESLTLHEFPQHPRRSEDIVVKHCVAPVVKPDNFHFVFSDANKPCFKPCFDVVVTPWLIDIQPLVFNRFLRQLNQYLPVGGHWVNFGSLVFNQRRERHCYSIDEVQEIAAEQGFEIVDLQAHDIPYLKSPYNAGHRVEHVWCWTALKTKDVKKINDPQYLPNWLLDADRAIPQTPYLQQFAFTHRIYAQLAGEVDGKTSLARIARRVAKQNRMDHDEALESVKNFFLEIHQHNQQAP